MLTVHKEEFHTKTAAQNTTYVVSSDCVSVSVMPKQHLLTFLLMSQLWHDIFVCKKIRSENGHLYNYTPSVFSLVFDRATALKDAQT